MLENEKRKRKFTFKRTNLATWGKHEVDFDNEEEKDKEALLWLMALDLDSIEVLDSNLSSSSDNEGDIDDLYHELSESLVRAKKQLKSKIVESESLV